MYATQTAFKIMSASTTYTPSYLWMSTLKERNAKDCMYDINEHGNILFKAFGEKLPEDKTVLIRIAWIQIDEKEARFKNANDIVYLNHGKKDWKTL
jgi:hypothetical protein